MLGCIGGSWSVIVRCVRVCKRVCIGGLVDVY